MRQFSRRGFTLIELLVVIAIIAILIAPPLARSATGAGGGAADAVPQQSQADRPGLHNYHDAFRTFPCGWIGVEDGLPTPHDGGSGVGWGAMILPYVDQANLYAVFDPDISIENPLNDEFRLTTLDVFRCPSDPQPDRFEIEEEGSPGAVICELPIANYVGSFGTVELDGCENTPGAAPVLPTGQCVGDGVFYHNSRVLIRDITDGTSNTFLVGERKTVANDGWYSTWVGRVAEGEEAIQRVLGAFDHTPNHPDTHFDDFSSRHEGGAHFVLADGHVRFVSENIDGAVYRAVGTIQGGEIVGEF